MTTPTTPTTTNDANPPAERTASADLLYEDLEQELATTRRVLERVPDADPEWRPHEKSMSLAFLATHVAELPGFAAEILGSDEVDLLRRGHAPQPLATTAERLALFDENAAAMRSAIAAAEPPALDGTWTLRAGDRVILNDRRRRLLRSFVLSHMIHHRAQLGVYLRLLGVAVPGAYGPSADER